MTLKPAIIVGGNRAAWVHGWAVSAVVHAVLVVAVMMGLPPRQTKEVREAFRWDVQLVTSLSPPGSGPSAPSAPSQQRSPVPTPAAIHGRVVQERVATRVIRQMDTMPLVETWIVEAPTSRLDRMEHKEAGQRYDVERIVEMQRIEQPTPIERERREEVRPEMVVRNEHPTAKDLSQAPAVASIEPVVTSAAPEERVIETRASSIMDTWSAFLVGARPTARQAEAARASPESALASQSANEQETSASFPRSDRSGARHSGGSPSAELADTVGSESPHARAPNVVASQGSPPSGESKRLDYGWLAHTIRARIEEVKRYSIEARVNEWEGKVVISASILADGRIVDIRVVESSGNRRLDEDAKTMVGYVSPLTLSQSIGLTKVTVKVPIIFGLQ